MLWYQKSRSHQALVELNILVAVRNFIEFEVLRPNQ